MQSIKINVEISVYKGQVRLRHVIEGADVNANDNNIFGFPKDCSADDALSCVKQLSGWVKDRFLKEVAAAIREG